VSAEIREFRSYGHGPLQGKQEITIRGNPEDISALVNHIRGRPESPTRIQIQRVRNLLQESRELGERSKVRIKRLKERMR
jgi:hypothetical protein